MSFTETVENHWLWTPLACGYNFNFLCTASEVHVQQCQRFKKTLENWNLHENGKQKISFFSFGLVSTYVLHIFLSCDRLRVYIRFGTPARRTDITSRVRSVINALEKYTCIMNCLQEAYLHFFRVKTTCIWHFCESLNSQY